MTAMNPGPGPADQTRPAPTTGAVGGLGPILGLAVLGTGVVAALVGFADFYTGGGSFYSVVNAPVPIGLALFAGLVAALALLPKQAAQPGVAAAAAVAGFVVVLFQVVGRGAGFKDSNLLIDACGDGCTVRNRIVRPVNPAIGKFAPTVSIDGNPLPQAPKKNLNFTLRYSIPTKDGEWYAYTDWVYRSKVNFFLYESVEFTGKSLTEGGLRLGYVWGNGNYEVAAYSRNITNQIRVVGGIDFNNLTGFINDPRTYGLQFKAKF